MFPVTPGLAAEHLEEAECLRLISPGGIGRLAYSHLEGPVVLPVSYKLYEGTILFRTGQDSPVGEDLRTGIAGAEHKVLPGPNMLRILDVSTCWSRA